MDKQFKRGQDVLGQYAGGSAISGFNRRVYGDSYAEAFHYEAARQDREMYAGWVLAEQMIQEGKLFYQHNFHKVDCPDGYAFRYGGTMVCNTCGHANVQREWWKIKVFKDGNAWCCIGTGFENLQESDNYAFGDTRDEAIENYGQLMKGNS